MVDHVTGRHRLGRALDEAGDDRHVGDEGRDTLDVLDAVLEDRRRPASLPGEQAPASHGAAAPVWWAFVARNTHSATGTVAASVSTAARTWWRDPSVSTTRRSKGVRTPSVTSWPASASCHAYVATDRAVPPSTTTSATPGILAGAPVRTPAHRRASGARGLAFVDRPVTGSAP